jgi:hypothetical protein
MPDSSFLLGMIYLILPKLIIDMDSQYIDPYLNILHILILSFSSESRTQLDVLTCRIAHAYLC